MSQQESVAYLIALVLLLAFGTPYVPSGPSDGIINPFSCKQIEGSVVLKKHDDDGHKLYVELYIEEYDNAGYIVWVSNKTYHAFEV